MNKKIDRIFFVNTAKKLVENNGMMPILTNKPNCDNAEYRLKTDKNELTICIRPENTHEVCYSVYGYLKTPSKTIGNPYSGKVNFHAAYSNVNLAVMDFEDHLKTVIENELN